jgi:glycerophosphoryl diester phosphodiesterase
VPVLLHDSTVDRTTDGAGEIASLSLRQARRLDAGDGERIPTLREVLETVAGRALLVLEIKPVDIEEPVLAVVSASGGLDWCCVHSFWPQVVDRIRALEPRMPCSLLTGGREVKDWRQFFAFALSLGAQGVSVHYTFATPEIVRQGQRRSLTFMTWTVDDESAIERMVIAGADSICSNFPDVVREIVERRVRA